MPIGNELGSFSLKSTSINYSPADGGTEIVDMNMEGSIEGPNGNLTVLGTLTGRPNADAQSGTYTWLGREFAVDGATRIATGGGFFINNGAGTWALRGHILFSDGTGGAVEGQLNLADRSLIGKLCEWT